MSMDRLAALRARQQQAPAPNDYELSPVQGADNGEPVHSVNGTSDDFYDEVSKIQGLINQYNENVTEVKGLQAKSLNVVDGSNRGLEALDTKVDETRLLGNQIKEHIQALKERPVSRGQEARRNQVNVVANRFITSLQKYKEVENDYRSKQRARAERQYRMVKPGAHDDEVAAFVNNTDGDSGQIFSQALSSTGAGAYREVEDRHRDLVKIEQTLEQLAHLFNDMSLLVTQQDDSINYILNTAQDVEQDATKGVEHTDKAVGSARAARKKRWICFGICILVLAIVAAIVAGVIATRK